MNFRRIPVRLWGTKSFRRLSTMEPTAQSLYIVLVAGPSTGVVPGLLDCGIEAIAGPSRWTVVDVERAMGELVDASVVRLDAAHRVIALPAVLATAVPASRKAAASWARAIAAMPPCELVAQAKAWIERRIASAPPGVLAGWRGVFDMAAREKFAVEEQAAAEGGAMRAGTIVPGSANRLSASEITSAQAETLEIWNNAAAWVREHHPKGRRWATHKTLPQKSTGPIRQHLERFGRDEFLAQLKVLLRWAMREEFWVSLRHDGHQSDNWIPTVISALDVEKWDVRIDVAEASHENHRTLDQESADEDAREAAANEELQRILAIEREKIRRADEAAGGDSNSVFADDTPFNDPELMTVEEAADELIRRNRNGAAS